MARTRKKHDREDGGYIISSGATSTGHRVKSPAEIYFRIASARKVCGKCALEVVNEYD